MLCLHRDVSCRKGLVEGDKPVQGHWLGSCRHMALSSRACLNSWRVSGSGREEMKNSLET